MNEERASRIAEAVRRAIRAAVVEEFDGNFNAASQAIGIPKSTFYRYIKPENYTTDNRGVPLTILATIADWLHEERGHRDFGVLWRETRLEVERSEFD